MPDLGGVERQVADKIAACGRYAAARPDSAHAWGVLAMNLDVHGFDGEALAAYERAAELDPRDLRWPYLRAIVLAEQGAPEARAWFERASALRPGWAPLLVRRAETLLAAGQAELAGAVFAAAAAADPELAPAHLGRAKVALALGDVELAREQALQAVAVAPRYRQARLVLAELHRRLGDPDQAERERRLAARLPELDPLPDPVVAALVAEGVSSYWYWQRGRALLERGQSEKAAEELERALAIAPRAEVHDDLGLTLQQLGRPGEAAEQHRAALALRPGLAAAWGHLGVALHDAGDTDGAIAALERALELRPDLPGAALNLGTFEQQAGRRARAIASFRRGLDHDPDDLRLPSRLAWLLATAPEAELRDGEEAARLAREVCERTGFRLAEALDVLAAAEAERGRFEAAVETAARALELATGAGREELARSLAARLELYRAQRPYRLAPAGS